MIAEIIPDAYDANGHRIDRPFSRRHGYHSTFPIGRYLSHPLGVQCRDVADIRRFLASCRYVSDQELFGRKDFWQPPDEFEKRKQGDCEDFALWTWRQLLSLGYDARFVVGACGRYGYGHAWVEYFQDGKCYLVEPQANRVATIPRLSTIRYSPNISVAWDGKTIKYFSHPKPKSAASLRSILPLLPDYLVFWAWFCLVASPRLPQATWKLLKKYVFRREAWLRPNKPEY
jgi:hypothetical protein